MDDGISARDIDLAEDKELVRGAYGVVYSGKLMKGGSVTEVRLLGSLQSHAKI